METFIISIINFTTLYLFFQTYASSSNNTTITASSNVTCIQRERQSLLLFRQGLVDESNRLSTWTGVECCEWHGVGCDRRNGHVVKLDLQSPSSLPDDYDYNERKCFKGKVSPSLLNLKHLRYLDLSMNNFSGQNIPKYFGSFKHLEYLNLSYSRFSGAVPPHLGNLSRLQYLDLSYNDDSLMANNNLRWVSLLSSLKHLDFSGITIGNHIDWFHPVNMLPSLLTLNLAGCDINIASIKVINFTSLNSLDLSSNGINSTIPVWLSNLTGLVHLDLSHNQLCGPIPPSLGGLSSLTSLSLWHNELNGGIPDFIGNLSSLSYMDLGYNQLSGPIPPSLGGLSSLTSLYLDNNKLSGNIPTSLKRLTRLKELYLSSNQLNGSIPTSLGQLSNLKNLILYNNQLNGSIPESIGLLTSLQTLYLSVNQLSGNIPHSIGQLSNLQFLALSYNQLSGVVSEDHFTKLYNLTKLWLSGNSLITWNVSPHWIPPFQLERLEASYVRFNYVDSHY